MTQTQPYIEEVEKKLLNHIIEGLRTSKISTEQSEELARQFLTVLPPKDKEDLLQKLSELGKVYPPAQETYAEVFTQEAELKRQTALAAMRDHIKSGNIEAAIAVAKGEK